MNHKHHVIPKHIGGTNDLENLVELSIEEHAEAHRILFEKHGRWQDKLAWKGLSGQIGKEEIIEEILRRPQVWTKERKEAHLKRMIGNKINKGRVLTEEHKAKIVGTGRTQSASQKEKVAKALAKEWLIITPAGEKISITNLHKYCREHDIDQGNMVAVSKGRLKQHKGYKCVLLEVGDV